MGCRVDARLHRPHAGEGAGGILVAKRHEHRRARGGRLGRVVIREWRRLRQSVAMELQQPETDQTVAEPQQAPRKGYGEGEKDGAIDRQLRRAIAAMRQDHREPRQHRQIEAERGAQGEFSAQAEFVKSLQAGRSLSRLQIEPFGLTGIE